MIFIAPKNFKRGRLIGNKYRIIDLVIACTLILISVVLVLTYVLNSGKNIIVIMIMLLPALAAGLILIPLGFYHNLVQRIILWINFMASRKVWKWQGTYWYTTDEEGDDQ